MNYQHNLKINKYYQLGIFTLFILSPILSLVFIIDGMRKNMRYAYSMFALFISLVAFMLAPTSDLASHNYLYYEYQNLSWNTFVNYRMVGSDYVMQYIEWIFANCGIPFEFIRLLQTLIAFFLLNSIFFYKINNSSLCYSSAEVFGRYLCYILVFPFILMVGGVRFGFGVVIMLYGFHQYIDREKRIIGIILLIFASLVHFSLLYYSLFSFIILHLDIRRNQALVLALIMFILSIPLQATMEEYLLQNELRGAGYLGDGIWGRQVGMSLKINAIVYHWGQRVFLLPLLFLLFCKYNHHDKWSRLGLSYILFFTCIYSAFALAQRTTVCFMTCSIFLVLSIENSIREKIAISTRRVIIICSVLICCFDIWTHREQILLSRYWRLAQPSVITLTQEYDKSWLLQHAYESR